MSESSLKNETTTASDASYLDMIERFKKADVKSDLDRLTPIYLLGPQYQEERTKWPGKQEVFILNMIGLKEDDPVRYAQVVAEAVKERKKLKQKRKDANRKVRKQARQQIGDVLMTMRPQLSGALEKMGLKVNLPLPGPLSQEELNEKVYGPLMKGFEPTHMGIGYTKPDPVHYPNVRRVDVAARSSAPKPVIRMNPNLQRVDGVHPSVMSLPNEDRFMKRYPSGSVPKAALECPNAQCSEMHHHLE